MGSAEKIRVVVVQGRCLVPELLEDRVAMTGAAEICARAETFEEACQAIALHRPQVLLVKASHKCCGAALSLAQFKQEFHWLPVVAFSCNVDLENVLSGAVFPAGADAYVSSEDAIEDLAFAIQAAWNGESFISDQMKHHLAVCEALKKLSHREAEVFYLTGCGYVPRRVAEIMGLSVKTIETYRERIRDKMNLRTGADLLYASSRVMREVARHGTIGSDEEIVRGLISATT